MFIIILLIIMLLAAYPNIFKILIWKYAYEVDVNSLILTSNYHKFFLASKQRTPEKPQSSVVSLEIQILLRKIFYSAYTQIGELMTLF
jgi:hypothetical protein